MTERSRPARRRTVATRVLLSYVIVMVAFALVTGWSVIAQREAAREADLMRSGYLPMALSLRDLVASQDTWNTQLNHVTAARNPADIRVWFEFARLGRPKKFAEVRSAINRSFSHAGTDVQRLGDEVTADLHEIERLGAADTALLNRLFEALEQRNDARAERLRDDLVKVGTEAKRRVMLLEERVRNKVIALHEEARERERLAVRLLFALAVLTVLVGVVMAVYAQRVLRPLGAVTERAKSVALGDLTPRPVFASNDEIGELATTFEGMVSAIARANEQLLATERLATIGKMAAHVTHEIRNPLSSIALNLELMEEELGQSDGEAKALLRAITSEVDRLKALSEQYLSVARRQPVRLEREDVGQVVDEAVDFVRRDLERQGVVLRLQMDSELPEALVDEAQLKQALYNLIRNAQEAMTSGGEISVRVLRVPEGIEIAVEDDGPGIDESARTQLFEPFFTTKRHGTGLGLAITRQIVEAHGGTIACAAREGRGTSMVIALRAASERAVSEAEAPV
jgi:signal transduction histidine kinase